MRKITYEKLTIQNFLSIGNDTITIDFRRGLSHITGRNIDNPERKNAIGKSCIVESYYYALFGTTIRDIKKEFIVNNVTKGKGKVELWFNVQTDTATNSYKIVRQVKPSSVELYKLGDVDEDISKDSIANTNKYICELIGSNSVISKSCDILSLSDNIPFMAKKPEEKRKFIEDIFALEIFGKMMKDLKEMVRDNKVETSVTLAKCQEIKHSITTLSTQLESQKKQIEEKEENLRKRKGEIEDHIATTERSISDLIIRDNSQLEADIIKCDTALDTIDDRIDASNVGRSQAELNIRAYKSQLAALLSIEFGSKCSKCQQEIPKTADYIEDEKLALGDMLKSASESYTSYTTELEKSKTLKNKIKTKKLDLEKTISDNNTIRQKFDTLSTHLQHYKESLKNLNIDLEDTNIGVQNFEALIDDTAIRLNDSEEAYKALLQKQEDLETCRFILGEEGIKSFIIKRLLEMLNTSIQKYITDLGMTMKCKFDEYFDEQITNDKGKDISYWNFSGGERMTIDIACAWAFKDIKRKISGVSSNVEFLDEFMDKSLDVVGLERLIEVLKERIDKHDMSVYTISHRVETLKHIDSETVMLEKENGVTRRIM